MVEDSDTIVDVHYNEVFTPTPLMYFDGVKAYVPYTVVNKMNFPDFIPFLEKLTNGRCRDVYYCPHEVRLSERLHAIQNDCDFNKFLEDINEKKRLDVYVDHHHEPLFDCIQEGEADLEDDDLVSIDDVDSILEDGMKVEHVEDDEVISLRRNFNDQFLNKLCPIQNDDLVEEDHNAIRPIYLRHDHTRKWNEMKPRLSMKYSTTAELKYSLSCYVVANGYDLCVGQCRNAKKLALSEVEGSLKEHYAKLWDYTTEIRRANPDGCRKVIGVDGCFLKGVCRGELLSVVGRDANNNIYPLVWAIVNVENKRTWKCFLNNLMEDTGGENGHDITILSDGHKGLFEDVKERLPDVEHRLCARHILANFHKKI
uniref:MULE transposase domain-containing protein n=1 Tax=Lactuca sativa TaxID=4236 RepID=A0A9R1UE05_LACSA|nr:hypothetical protein LSAT_V11C900465470 [Lactuca sativa]